MILIFPFPGLMQLCNILSCPSQGFHINLKVQDFLTVGIFVCSHTRQNCLTLAVIVALFLPCKGLRDSWFAPHLSLIMMPPHHCTTPQPKFWTADMSHLLYDGRYFSFPLPQNTVSQDPYLQGLSASMFFLSYCLALQVMVEMLLGRLISFSW